MEVAPEAAAAPAARDDVAPPLVPADTRGRGLGPPVVLGPPAIAATFAAPIRQVVAPVFLAVDKDVIVAGPPPAALVAGERVGPSARAGRPGLPAPLRAAGPHMDIPFYTPAAPPM